MAKSEFLKIFKERGFFHQCTDEASLDHLLSAGPVVAYGGFDCTANSLHVGNLIQIMILKWLKNCGHKPIILLGGATTKIGDPSGKDESRPVITDEIIAANMAGIAENINQFGLKDALIVNNNDWIAKLSLMDMLQVARHFSVNRMLTFDSVKTRLERELDMSLLEFNYMVIQAYDFVELNKTHNCRLQIGGSDQWGNIVNGVELQRRLKKKEIIDISQGVKGKEAHAQRLQKEQEFEEEYSLFGLTTPLITTASGAKMGKSVSGAIWLSPTRLPPSDYWQFWRNTDDKDVGRFLRLFTLLPIAEIEKLEKLHGAEINQAKIVLANEATKLCHGEVAANNAYAAARNVFEQNGVSADLPVLAISQAELVAGIAAFKILHMAGLADSGGEAKNLIKNGGAKINDIKINDISQLVRLEDLNADGVIKLAVGKKKHALVKVLEQ